MSSARIQPVTIALILEAAMVSSCFRSATGMLSALTATAMPVRWNVLGVGENLPANGERREVRTSFGYSARDDR